MTVDPNYTKPRDGDDRAWNVPSEARETFERVSSLQLEELLRTANGDEARGRAGRDGNGFAMPEDSDADENSSDESEVSDAGDEREDLEDVDDVERGAQRTIEVSGEEEMTTTTTTSPSRTKRRVGESRTRRTPTTMTIPNLSRTSRARKRRSVRPAPGW